MTKLDNSAQFAKDACREAMIEARELQARLGVPKSEQCSLPATFNRFRNIERINALTEEFDAVVVECLERLELEVKAEAAKPAQRTALEELEYASKQSAARKRCDKALVNAQNLQRKAGLTVTPSRSFKSASLEELARLENEYAMAAKAAIALMPKPAPKPELVVTTTKVVTKVEEPQPVAAEAVAVAEVVETKATKKAPQPEYGKARIDAAEAYKKLLMRLIRLEDNYERYAYREHELYREQPLTLTKRELRLLTAEITARIAAIPPKVPMYKQAVSHQPFKGWAKKRGIAA